MIFKLEQIAEAIQDQFGSDAGYVVLIHVSEEVLVISNLFPKDITQLLQAGADHVKQRGPNPDLEGARNEDAPEAGSGAAESDPEPGEVSDTGEPSDPPLDPPERAGDYYKDTQ